MEQSNYIRNEYSKKDSSRLWKDGCGIIDTSGRTRTSSSKNIIALTSNTIEYSVLYKANTKSDLFEKYKSKYSREKLIIKIHCIGIYYCLKDCIENMPYVFICHEGLNKGEMYHYLQQLLKEKYSREKIIIDSLIPIFGKKNRAHVLAYAVNKKGKKPSLILTKDYVEKFL